MKNLGKFRDEFCVDHLHIFSIQSVSNMAEKSGFSVNLLKELLIPQGSILSLRS